MGSASDWSIMEHAARTLRDFGIPWIAEVAGAHHSLDMLRDFAVHDVSNVFQT